ncbi:DNA polymerase III subunit epsilon [Parvularcula dongshanensis]|uniref:DNA polymerase III subunit epsilon n=1 Tax=Parvularcula dongshanensis TaxID=1173995 RepID=A0A840I184_9PROT|nr:DNA polymerase III subunit epsilon [Parvularcula dongshanensis]MBB4658041.1 DNA polymerase-3 subunit epsilon [Parvularcula dongshanensis]
MRHVIFDTETTGLSPKDGHRVIEIGAVEMAHGGLTGRTFHVYIDPERDVPAEATRVHNITEAMLRGKPKFAHPSVGRAFAEFVGDAVLVAHNAPFDMGFLNHEFELAGLPRLSGEVIDTVQMARRRFPGSPASLDALCARFGIDTAQRERDGHGALLDSRLLAEVWIELTGGRQGGLDLAAQSSRRSAGGARRSVETPQRPGPRPVLLTEEEKAAHAAFVAEMKAPVWAE